MTNIMNNSINQNTNALTNKVNHQTTSVLNPQSNSATENAVPDNTATNSNSNNESSIIRPLATLQQSITDSFKNPSPRISTGFLPLDKVLGGGLQNELYIMAAETSTGKSAFMMTLAQNIASSGVDVIYVSLEMGALEYVARAISTLSFIAHKSDSSKPFYSVSDILSYRYNTTLEEFEHLEYEEFKEYSDIYFEKYGSTLHIIEPKTNGVSTLEIYNNIKTFYTNKMKSHNPRPTVLFIDYLQLIASNEADEYKSDRKTKIDKAVMCFKKISSEFKMPVFVLSSISRSNYGNKIGTSSFKESGDIEYTAGVIIGWNWEGVTNAESEGKMNEEKMKCLERGYRRMTFEILKSRNAQRDISLTFRYYPGYSYFKIEANDDSQWHPFKKGDPDFSRLTQQEIENIPVSKCV